MAYEQVHSLATHYVGLSTEPKPTDETVKVGSRARETDTGHEYVYDGEAWSRLGSDTDKLLTDLIAATQLAVVETRAVRIGIQEQLSAGNPEAPNLLELAQEDEE